MIPKAKAIKLIKNYFYICEQCQLKLKHLCERFSNKNQPGKAVKGMTWLMHLADWPPLYFFNCMTLDSNYFLFIWTEGLMDCSFILDEAKEYKASFYAY